MTWTRRQFLVMSSAAAAGAGLLPWPALAQQAPPPVTGRFEAIRRNVGVFTARGGTIGWLISPRSVIVVDSQYADSAQICVDGIKQRTTRTIDALINTHHHADHTGGNGVFRSHVKKIIAHARVPELQKNAAIDQKSEASQVYADRTFEKAWAEEAGDEKLVLEHFGPGHTGGDAVVTFQKANVVHMGDLVFNRVHPRVDRPAGASIKGWIDRLATIPGKHERDTIYIFGHAKPGVPVTGSRAELDEMRRYFTAVLEYVQKGIKAGQSRDEIAGAAELPGFTDYVSLGQALTLKGVLGVAYDELTAGTARERL